MNNSNILISWIIIGRNWGNDIEELTSALNKQSWDHNIVELILVDDASTDSSNNALNNIQFENKKIIILDQHTGRCGAQNTGIKKAQGQFCLFTQSNTIPEKDFLKKYIDYLSILKGDGAAGIINYTCSNNSFENYLNQPMRGLKKIQDNYLIPIDYVLFGNCAIRTELLKDINGFNEKLIGYGGEEIDLLYRINKIKKLKIFKLSASVIRVNHPELKDHIQRLIEFGSTNFKELPADIQSRIIPKILLQLSIFIPTSIIHHVLLLITKYINSFFFIRMLMGISILKGYKN